MRFTPATVAALVAIFAVSSAALAGEVDHNKVGLVSPETNATC
jgi:hypothetical protein